MAVSITGGPVETRGPGYHSTETLAQATATAAQALQLDTSANILGMGTATGFGVNVYSLEAGTEGQKKVVFSTATGEAKLVLSGTTATGQLVFSALDDLVKLEFIGAKWRILTNSGATLATAT